MRKALLFDHGYFLVAGAEETGAEETGAKVAGAEEEEKVMQ